MNDIDTETILDNTDFFAPSTNKHERRLKGLYRARRLLRIYRAKNPLLLDEYCYGGKIEHLLIKTRVPCSCAMCGNPRRYAHQLTPQEINSSQEMIHGINF